MQFDSKLQNQTARLDEKIDKAAENFNILGTNLTEQLQKQEIHAAKSWVSRELNSFSSSKHEPRFLMFDLCWTGDAIETGSSTGSENWEPYVL